MLRWFLILGIGSDRSVLLDNLEESKGDIILLGEGGEAWSVGRGNNLSAKALLSSNCFALVSSEISISPNKSAKNLFDSGS
jgi:hypothetical protein